jgi:hypothetical protein
MEFTPLALGAFPRSCVRVSRVYVAQINGIWAVLHRRIVSAESSALDFALKMGKLNPRHPHAPAWERTTFDAPASGRHCQGKDKTFTVDAKTEFWGPKGGDRGTGPKGLADECMAKGYEIKVVPTKDPTVAKDVYLPNRKPK